MVGIPSEGARLLRPAVLLLGLLALGIALAAAGWQSMSAAELERRLLSLDKNAPVGELTRVANAVELEGEPAPLDLVHVRVPARREAGRAPVLLVHGTPSTLFTWAPLLHGGDGFEGLAQERDAIAIEVIGHGVAPGDAEPASFQRCAEFVVGAVRALDLGPVHLVGSSYGGEFAWRAALDAPELFASVTLIDSSGYERREQDWLPEEVLMRESSLAKLGWLLNSRERIASALAPHFPEIPPDRVEEFFLVCERASNWRAMVDLARDENGARQDELASLEPPALVLWGEADIAYPPEVYAERFARDLPNARLVVLGDTGHYPHEQRPAEVVEILARFFDSVEGTQ